MEVEELLEIGLIVAPLLLRGIPSFDVDGKVFSLFFFELFQYDPAIPLLIQTAADTLETRIGLTRDQRRIDRLTVGEWSIYALRRLAETSENAKRALISVLTTPLSQEFIHIINLPQVLGDDITLSPRGKHSPKPAESIA